MLSFALTAGKCFAPFSPLLADSAFPWLAGDATWPISLSTSPSYWARAFVINTQATESHPILSCLGCARDEQGQGGGNSRCPCKIQG